MSKSVASLIFLLFLVIVMSTQAVLSQIDSTNKKDVNELLKEIESKVTYEEDDYFIEEERYYVRVLNIEPIFEEKVINVSDLIYEDGDGYKNTDIVLEGDKTMWSGVTYNPLSIPYTESYVSLYNPNNIIRTTMVDTETELVPNALYQILVKDGAKYSIKLKSLSGIIDQENFKAMDLDLKVIFRDNRVFYANNGYKITILADGLLANNTKMTSSPISGEITLEDDEFEVIGDAIVLEIIKREQIGFKYDQLTTIVDKSNNIIYSQATKNEKFF